MKSTLKVFLIAALAAVSLFTSPAAALSPRLQAAGTSPSTSTKKTTAKAAPSSQDIADAKAKGMVWANLSTHVYHKGDSSMYGATKRGKFMTEDDAKKAGFRAANESGALKKKTAAASATK